MKKNHLLLASLVVVSIACTRSENTESAATSGTGTSTMDTGAAGNAQSNATANPNLDTNTAGNMNSAESYQPGQKNVSGDMVDPDPESQQLSGGATGAVSQNSGAQNETGKDRSQLTQNTSRNAQESRMIPMIQAAIANSNEISAQAKQTQVTSQNGQIYLKGTAANDAEKSKIEQIAKQVAGNNTVVNQLTVQK